MTTLTKTIADPDFVNWVKAGLVLQFTKEGVEDLVSTVTNTFHQNIMRSIPGGITCTACKAETVLPCPTTGICGGQPNCRYHSILRPTTCTSCEHFRNKVFDKHRFRDNNAPHRFGGPSWRNTDVTQWSTNHWELAKCYMARDGYSHVTSAKETDLPGLLSVIINHTDFQTNLAENLNSKTNIFCTARQIRNDILHSATQRLTEADLKKYIKTMIRLLSDPALNAQNAIAELTKIDNGTMIITEEDIEKMKSEATKAIKEIGKQQVDDIKIEGQLQIKAINISVEDGKKAIKEEAKTKTDESKRTLQEKTEASKVQIEAMIEKGQRTLQEKTTIATEEGKRTLQKETAIATDEIKRTLQKETAIATEEGKRTLQKETAIATDEIKRTLQTETATATEEGKITLQKETAIATEEGKKTLQKETAIATEAGKRTLQKETAIATDEGKRTLQKETAIATEEGKKTLQKETAIATDEGKRTLQKETAIATEEGKRTLQKETAIATEEGKRTLQKETAIATEEGKRTLQKETAIATEEGKRTLQKETAIATEEGKRTLQKETAIATDEGKRTLQKETAIATEEGKKTLQKETAIATEAGKRTLQKETAIATEEGKRTLQKETALAKKSIQKILHSGAAGNNSKTEYENKKYELKRKLIEIYKARHLTTELIPSNSDVDVKIAETYVQPHMQRVSVRKRGKTEVTETRDEQDNKEDIIRSYRDIFEKDPKGQDSQPCENIYISGDAGSGKSSLCKHMVSTWCDVHYTTKQASSSTNTEPTPIPENAEGQAEFIQQDNKTEMTQIDFVFYVSLRDCMSEEHVEEMIKSVLPPKYYDIIPEVLDDEEEQCLIILDGLDEWTPPKHYNKNPSITKGLPKREVWSKCSFLTTTRPWKLAHLGMKSSEIDRHVNILGIDDASSRQLINKVVDLLNAEYGRDKDADEFKTLLWEKSMEEMMGMPVMLKQLICLWHDGKSIGESQCDIYSGMFELLFEKAESRLCNIDGYKEITETGSKLQLPKCFSNHKKCQQIIALLLSLANLAFLTIFSDNNSSTLVFEKSVAEYHGMSQAEMEICLKAGILSQTKHKDKCTEQNVKISFLHKTFQEFLAALYIALPHESSEDTVDHIFHICDSVYKVLEMYKVFVFVAGMSPTKASTVSEHIGTVASADEEILKYRQDISKYDQLYENVLYLQSLIEDCFTEGELNGHAGMRLHLQDVTDIMANDMAKYLKNIDNIKSASMEINTDQSKTYMHDLCGHNLQTLHLKTDVSYTETVHINSDSIKILQCSSSSLTVLYLRLDMSSLTTEQFSNILYSLSCLLSIRLDSCTMTHEQYQCFVKFISQKTQLRKIMLKGNKIHDFLQEHSSEMNTTELKNDDDSITDDDSMSTISQEDIQKLSTQKQIKSLSNTDSDCNVSTNLHSPNGCNIIDKCKQCYVLDLSHHSQLDTLCIEDSFKTHKCTSQKNCMQNCFTECDSTMESLKGALKLHTLRLDEDCTPQAIIQILPTLTNLQSIDILNVDFGREQLRLSSDMQHITKICLYELTMTKTGICGFVDSIPVTPHTVSVIIFNMVIKPAKVQTKPSSSDISKNSFRDTLNLVEEYIKQSPRFLVYSSDEDDDKDDDKGDDNDDNKDDEKDDDKDDDKGDDNDDDKNDEKDDDKDDDKGDDNDDDKNDEKDDDKDDDKGDDNDDDKNDEKDDDKEDDKDDDEYFDYINFLEFKTKGLQ